MTYHYPSDELGHNESACWNHSIAHTGMWFVNDHKGTYYAVVDDFGNLVRCAA